MINIAELLKDAPKGMKLYSPLFGEVFLYTILSDSKFITVRTADSITTFNKFGQWGDNSRLERFPDAECLLFPSKDCRTWEGWKLPVEPMFKVGDWLYHNTCGVHPILVKGYNKRHGYKVECIETSYYLQKGVVENEYHLWSIADAKDGDVLVCYSEVKGNPIEQAGIFKQYVGRHGGCSNTFLAHTGIDWDGNIIINGYMGSTNILPATKEKRDQFFKKMLEVGYQWDADKKELHKIQPHYDIKNFYVGMPVLVRADNNCRWDYSVFSRITGNEDWPFAVCNGVSFTQCIPFEGNEHLLGTTDMCDEMYINW